MTEIKFEDVRFPKKLKMINKSPKRLFIKGNQELLLTRGIAVIGTRHPSSYGKRMCKAFTKELVKYGITIISGMAQGIDTIAHNTCLENGGKTIAVLPSGFNNIFPKSNDELFNNIIQYEGAIVTEYLPDEKAESKKFLERNRIVAGLAIGTLVIEAGYRSGTSVTARLTREQNKKVFCIPSSLENRHGITCNQIIQEGGKLVTCVEDIISEYEEYNFVKSEELNALNFIDDELKDIYSVLTDMPQHINEIAKKLDMSIKDINYKLMMLELDDKIVELPGKYFTRK